MGKKTNKRLIKQVKRLDKHTLRLNGSICALERTLRASGGPPRSARCESEYLASLKAVPLATRCAEKEVAEEYARYVADSMMAAAGAFEAACGEAGSEGPEAHEDPAQRGRG